MEKLEASIKAVLAARVRNIEAVKGELTLVVAAADLPAAMLELRNHEQLRFAQLTDLCGIDYRDHAESDRHAARFAVVYHLLSLEHNRRLRVRAYCEDDGFPVMTSVVDVWPSANWFEREAFDMFGIIFTGHPDLRRLLTDYGFVGHPFRKDFPLSGNVEMRYDPDQRRVIYQPVTIEPREIVPRVVREDRYGDVE